nr:hypothetical protein Itr_chr08CG08980 [Ipomoea trifida]
MDSRSWTVRHTPLWVLQRRSIPCRRNLNKQSNCRRRRPEAGEVVGGLGAVPLSQERQPPEMEVMELRSVEGVPAWSVEEKEAEPRSSCGAESAD